METINHECYVSPEVAKLLKKSGFDWKCYKVYKTDVTENLTLFTYAKEEGYRNTSEFICSAPTLEVAQRWLREAKGYSIYPTRGGYKIYVLDINDSTGFSSTYELNSNLTYEESQEAGIKKVLELILEEGE